MTAPMPASVVYTQYQSGDLRNLAPLYTRLEAGVNTIIVSTNLPVNVYEVPNGDWLQKRLVGTVTLDSSGNGRGVFKIPVAKTTPVYLRIIANADMSSTSRVGAEIINTPHI